MNNNTMDSVPLRGTKINELFIQERVKYEYKKPHDPDDILFEWSINIA